MQKSRSQKTDTTFPLENPFFFSIYKDQGRRIDERSEERTVRDDRSNIEPATEQMRTLIRVGEVALEVKEKLVSVGELSANWICL